MKFNHIIIFSIKDFNSNLEKDGYYPKDGSVINAFIDNWAHYVVVVGFE